MQTERISKLIMHRAAGMICTLYVGYSFLKGLTLALESFTDEEPSLFGAALQAWFLVAKLFATISPTINITFS